MKTILFEEIKKISKKLGFKAPRNFSIEEPQKAEFGDYSTNIAMILSQGGKEDPRKIAEKFAAQISKIDIAQKTEVAGPGFINIFLKNKVYLDELKNILKQKENYGRSDVKKNKKVQVEYISANPTGPLHIGNARGGPIGEAIANLYEFLGYEVEREFYVNDTGLQIERFGRSLYYWFARKEDSKLEFPADGYPGDYIKEISETIQKEKKDEILKLKDADDLMQLFVKEGLYYTVKQMREDSELLGIKFDNWAYESDLVNSGKTEKVIDGLKEKGFTTSKEGALWFKSPDDPELNDKEAVLVKSDGALTYFSDDIAYHLDKIKRGFDLVIDVWGANHHGHLPRFRAAMRALGISDEKICILFYQYIRLKESGKAVSMGKRLGNFVSLRQLLESGVEPDAFKYFILTQNPNTTFDFDFKLAEYISEKNPVFYIKYAHARICSILRKADILNVISTPRGNLSRAEKSLGKLNANDSIHQKISRQARDDIDGGQTLSILEKTDLNLLKNPKEAALYKELVKFPELILEAEKDFQIQSLPHYAYKIATLFHDFYSNCQVLSEDKKLTAARLSLVLATKYVLANALAICDIEAPEKM